MKLRCSLFTLTFCCLIFVRVDRTLAKKRSEAFRRCLKQMKASFKDCALKLAATVEQRPHLNETAELVQHEGVENATVEYGGLTLWNETAADERYKIILELQSSLVEKLNKVPPGKLKIDLLERFKKELLKTMEFIPQTSNDTTEINVDAASAMRDSLIKKVVTELEQLRHQERMYDPKQRHRILVEEENERLQEEMKMMQVHLSTDLENRSKLEFPVNLANRIHVQVANSTTLKNDLATTMISLIESRDMLEETKRTIRECKRIYQVDITATTDLTNYLLQNIDLQIDLMTGVVRVMNRQPTLVSGTFGFDFTRSVVDRALVQKASGEIYEMTLSFAEMRKLHYKIKDYEWSKLANKTGLLFSRINAEILKQNEQFKLSQ